MHVVACHTGPRRPRVSAVVALIVGLAATMVLFLERPAFAQDYADAGAYVVDTSAFDGGLAGSVGGNLVVPEGPGPFPLLIASHGWSAAAAQQLGWAQHFASWGFVVAVPSFPNPFTPDATVDEGIIAQLIAIYSDPATESPAQGKVDPTRIGLEGHSAGGLASTIAAATLSPGALVLFDPVDAADAGRTAYGPLCSPVLEIFADPSACNNQEEWSTFVTDTSAPLIDFRVVGSTHCDGENMDRGAACGLVCGGDADPARQAVYARYATAFFLAKLKGDPQAAALLTQTALAADTAISSVGMGAGTPCADDGGVIVVTEEDGGTTIIGRPSPTPTVTPTPTSPPASTSTSSPTSASSGSGTGQAPSAPGGCACDSAGAAGQSVWAALFAGILLGSMALARRHARARG